MMLMIPKGYEKAAPGAMPEAEAVAAMTTQAAMGAREYPRRNGER